MEIVEYAQVELAPALATALLHSLWQCMLLALIAAATLRMLNRRSAALRHTAGLGFLLAMASLPAWTFLAIWSRPIGVNTSSVAPEAATPPIGLAHGGLVPSTSELAAGLCALWLVGVALMLLRYAGGLWWIGQLERRELPGLTPEWQVRLETLQRTMGGTRKIAVRVAADLIVPFTARLHRPVIWMPASMLAGLPCDQMKALFAHELAHIHRLDWLWNGLQCVIEALLFFHPAAWWLGRRIREEREHACDDFAVAANINRVSLAEALAALAHARHQFAQTSLSASRGSLMPRISRLLPEAAAPAQSWAPTGLLALLAAPLASGYAATSQRSAPGARDGGANRAQMSNSAAHTAPAEEVAHGVGQPTHAEPPARAGDAAAMIAEHASLASEEAARDTERAARVSERSARDAERAARVSERSARIAEQAARVSERSARIAEQAARAHAAEFSEASQPPVRQLMTNQRTATVLGPRR